MQLQRNKLALLISLIGAGVSPYAYARSDSRVAGPVQSPLSIALGESQGLAAEPVWRAEDGALELVWLPDDLHAAIWSRGSGTAASDEASADVLEALEAIEEAGESPTQFSDASSDASPGEMSRETAHAQRTPSASKQSKADAKPKKSKTSAAAEAPPAQPAAEPISPYAERLMESLAAVVLDDVSALAGDAAGTTLAAAASATQAEATAPADAAAAPPTPSPVVEVAQVSIGAQLRATEAVALPVEQREIVVAAPAEKVLRDLETLIWGGTETAEPSDAASAAPSPVETFVATQTDKVLAILQDVSSAYRTDEEEPAQRRARKLAKLEAREAAAAADAATITPAAPPTPTPVTLAVRHAMMVDVDLTQLMPVEPLITPLESSFDAAVALAMEPGPMQGFADLKHMAIDIAIDDIERAPRPSPFDSEKVAINSQELDRVRGGFIGEGLNISFGIERAVYINGSLVTTTSLNLSDLGRLTAGRATTSFDSGTLALIQSGAGNTITPGAFSSTSMGTVVQNTLNGQKIQSVTVINATVNSLGVLRGLNLGASMRGAVIDSLRR